MNHLIALKQVTAVAVIAMTIAGTKAFAETAARWEYQGVASTGERVYLNLDSIQADRSGYFFVYQIGRDRPTSFTHCDGRFQVASSDGVTFGAMIEPQSETTRRMLGRVCTYYLPGY
jgi:hypothetical protein